MAFSVVTNASALAALRTLNATQADLNQVQERINTGLKISAAKDGASTFAIAQSMRGDIAGFKSISNGLSMAQSTVSVASAAASKIIEALKSTKSKIVDAQQQNVDASKIQLDINDMIGIIDGIASAAQFNGVNLINDANAGTATAKNMTVLSSLDRAAAGATPTKGTVTVLSENLTSAGLGLAGLDVSQQSVELKFDSTFALADNNTITFTTGTGANQKTWTFEFVDDLSADQTTAAENIAVLYDPAESMGANLANLAAKMREVGFSVEYNDKGNLVVTHANGMSADATSDITGFVSGTASGGDPSMALDAIETALNRALDAAARLGSSENRLSIQQDFLRSLSDAMEVGVGSLVDADMAEESARLQALQTRQQLGIQALAIANQQPGSVLALFR